MNDTTNSIRVRVPVDSEFSYIVGRNGTFYVESVEARQANGYVHLDGIGKRGVPVRGGLRFRSAEAMDCLCLGWLRQRGLLPIRVVAALPVGGYEEELDGYSSLWLNGAPVYFWPELKSAELVSRVGDRVASALGVELITVEVEDPLDDDAVLEAVEQTAGNWVEVFRARIEDVLWWRTSVTADDEYGDTGLSLAEELERVVLRDRDFAERVRQDVPPTPENLAVYDEAILTTLDVRVEGPDLVVTYDPARIEWPEEV